MVDELIDEKVRWVYYSHESDKQAVDTVTLYAAELPR